MSNGGAETPPARVVVTADANGHRNQYPDPIIAAGWRESVPHERRHVDVVVGDPAVVAAADADRLSVGMHRHALPFLDGLEQRRAELARAARGDRGPGRTDDRLAAGPGGVEAGGDHVTRTSSPSESSMTVPKMMLASPYASIRLAAAETSNRPRSEPPRMDSRTPCVPRSMLAPEQSE